ncbi:hypothetical protein PISMIDRAFT_632895, partial [Pisolithus microcarpus 441]
RGKRKHAHLSGQEAAREKVLEALKRYDWVHIACHGQQDIQEPYRSYFEMYGGEKLTLLDLTGCRWASTRVCVFVGVSYRARRVTKPRRTKWFT